MTGPPKGSIPGRKPPKGLGDVLGGGTGNLLGGLLGGVEKLLSDTLKGLGKTIENIQNLNLEDLEKLAEAQGNEEAKENLKTLKEAMGREGIDLSKLVKIQSGVRGRILGRPFGGGLPLERRGESQETKFDVSGTRKQASGIKKAAPREVDIQELEIDPIEEDERSLKIRGYMAGVEEQDIVCEVKNNGTILRIAATGRRRYEKEVGLSSPVTEKADWSYRNGVLEVILTKEQG